MTRQLLADRDIAPGPVPDDVLRYWRQKGLRVGFSHLDVWREEHDLAFTVAKVMREDVLEAMRDEIDRAFAEGVPFERFKKEVEPRMRELGWWDEHEVQDPDTGKVVTVNPPRRLKTIYETNMRTSRAVGQYERIQANVDTRPYLLYQVGPSQRHREQHLAWHGLLLPASDPFWSYAFPPNGFGCKCAVRSVTVREHKQLVRDGVLVGEPVPILDDEGLPTGHVQQTRQPVRTTAPDVPLVPWRNARTGEVQLVRQGIDPGFDKRPGEGRRDALLKR
jgi:Phage Mu protein F like protein